MKAKRYLYLCLAILFLTRLFLPVRAAEPAEPTAAFDGYLVGLTEPVDVQLFSCQDAADMAFVTDTVCWVQTEAQAEELRSLGVVSYVEPNYIAELFADEIQEPLDAAAWNYEMVGAKTAVDLGVDGSGVRIGLIDSGVDADNPDLCRAKIGTGYDYVRKATDMCDTIYHGTKIAQILAGDGNDLGQTGLAPGVEIIPLRCFAPQFPTTAKVLSGAIYDAVDKYDCDILSMSWGLSGDSETLHNAIRYAREAGVLLVAASGNVTSTSPQGTKMYPACYQEVFSVSSVDSKRMVAASAQVNEHVFLTAPGEKLSFVLANGTVADASGTSFAAPHVTAGLALLLQLMPDLEWEEVSSLLETRVADVMTAGRDPETGHGLLQLDALIGQPWSRMQIDDDGTHFVGWCGTEAGGQVVLAEYQADGRMLETRIVPTEPGMFLFDETFGSADTERVLLFYLDTAGLPLGAESQFAPTQTEKE